MSIVEGGYYIHRDFGKVCVVGVDDGVVSMDIGSKVEEESVSVFRQSSEPADVAVSADPAVLDLTGEDV